MKRSRIIIFIATALLVPSLLLLIFGFTRKPEQLSNLPIPCSLQSIVEKGELNVVVDNNSVNYFIYKGYPMGFQYEMLSALAEEMGVKLNITVNNNLNEALSDLNHGVYDIFAKNFVVTKDRADSMSFTEPVIISRQVLVQRKLTAKTSMTSPYVSDLLDLEGKTIVVNQQGVYAQRLSNLSEEIGAPIHVVQDSINDVEQLIEMVANGVIDYTVCDENLANVNARLYRNVDISLPVSFNQKMSWAVRKGADDWKNYLDAWIVRFKAGAEYARIQKKYYSIHGMERMVNSEYHSVRGGKISVYDNLIKGLAQKYDLDWRLVSAIVIQESEFDPNAESWVGAAGLMQLMPQTAAAFGASNVLDPEQNLEAGMKYLRKLDKTLAKDISDPNERVKFVLAAYNVGLGHVLDARRLTKKYGKNDAVWAGQVEFFMAHKSDSKYYKDTVVKHGYCRGSEPVDYVSKVMISYGHYLNLIPGEERYTSFAQSTLQASLR